MGQTFAEKFEEALEAKRLEDDRYGVRTVARIIAGDDRTSIETIRRRLNKYRPKPGGGAAETAPTPPSRWEIEHAMGLERDALAPEESLADVLAARAAEARKAAVMDALLDMLEERQRERAAA